MQELRDRFATSLSVSYRRRVVGTSFLVLLFLVTVFGPESALAQYRARSGVVGNGGGRSTSSNYGTQGTGGQAVVGTPDSDNYHGGAGYWQQSGASVTTADQPNNLPKSYQLFQNFPNPFNPYTTIEFALPSKSRVRLSVYDVAGRLVATLVDKEMDPGVHAVEWDVGSLPSGIYFYRIRARHFSQSRKMVLLK
jgi:hypothetical protein